MEFVGILVSIPSDIEFEVNLIDVSDKDPDGTIIFGDGLSNIRTCKYKWLLDDNDWFDILDGKMIVYKFGEDCKEVIPDDITGGYRIGGSRESLIWRL